MERGGSSLLRHAGSPSPCASDTCSVSSPPPRRETLAAAEERAVVETMHGASLSAEEKGKQKAAEEVPVAGTPAPGLRPRALFPTAATAEIEAAAPPSPPPRPPRLHHGLDAARGLAAVAEAGTEELAETVDDLRRHLGGGSSSKCLVGDPRPGEDDGEARWFAGAGVPRRPLVGPSPFSEIEEAPPSPPPEGLETLAQDLRRSHARLALLRSQLPQLCGGEGTSKRTEGAPGPLDAAGRAAVAMMLVHELGMAQERLNIGRDERVALGLQLEEMEEVRDSLKASQEFRKPVPVPHRKNSKIGGTYNWKWIVSVTAFISGLVLIQALLPAHYYFTHIAITVCWTIGSIAIFCQLFETSTTTKGFIRCVARLMCLCFLLLALYVLYLILRLVGGAFAGLLGKRL